MLIPRLCKPFHFQSQFLIEFDGRPSILGGSMRAAVVDDHLVSIHFDIEVTLFPYAGFHFVTFARIHVSHLIVLVCKKCHHRHPGRHVAHHLHFFHIDFQCSFDVLSSVESHQFIYPKTPSDQTFVSLARV